MYKPLRNCDTVLAMACTIDDVISKHKSCQEHCESYLGKHEFRRQKLPIRPLQFKKLIQHKHVPTDTKASTRAVQSAPGPIRRRCLVAAKSQIGRDAPRLALALKARFERNLTHLINVSYGWCFFMSKGSAGN